MAQWHSPAPPHRCLPVLLLNADGCFLLVSQGPYMCFWNLFWGGWVGFGVMCFNLPLGLFSVRSHSLFDQPSVLPVLQQ